MTPKLKLKLGLVFLSVITLAGLALVTQLHVFAYPDSSLGDKSPWPANSYMPGQDGLVHVHYLRKQGATNGSQPYIELKAYYPKDISDRDWNQARLTFTPGNPLNDEHVCDKEATGMSSPNKFIYVEIKTGNAAGQKVAYWIPAANACTQQNHDNENGARSSNVFYGSYALPDKPGLDADTNKYVADVTISYSDEVPQGDNGIRFLVRGDGGSPKIGPLGSLTGNTSFSIIADWGLHDLNNRTAAAMTIPFGLPCSVRNNVSNAKVRIYDADNGLGFAHTVSFRVKNLDTGRYVTFTGKGSQSPSAGPGQWGDGGSDRTTYIPPSGSGNDVKAAWAEMGTFETDTHYQMEISGIDMRNTIDVGVPGDPINGTVRCGWKMKPTTTVDKDEAAPGDTVVFTHTGTNVGAFDTPNNIDITAKWGTDGKIRSGNVTPGFLVTSVRPDNPITDKSYTADENDRNHSRTITTTIVIPSNAANGDQYCQYLRVNHRSDKIPDAFDGDQACVTVRRVCTPPDPACPVPPRNVTVQAYVNSGGDAETQTTANFTGGVQVSGFPDISNRATADGEYGYSELSQPVAATRAQPTMTIPGTAGSVSRTTYTCPSGYSPTNPSSYSYFSCSKTVPTCPTGYSLNSPSTTQCYRILTTSPVKSGSNWVCPSGYGSFSSPIVAGSTCLKIEYVSAGTSTQYSYPNVLSETNYYCVSGGWTGYITGPSPCKNYYTCPAGSAGSGWATDPSGITCAAWECKYGAPPADVRPSPIVQVSPPKCEYRCPSTGARAWFDARDNFADYNGTGDRRCFVAPTFTVKCLWDTGAVTYDTVTGNGNFCTSAATSKAAGPIGTVVSATLTPSQQGGWQPSNPQPGMVVDRTTGAVRQMVTWGWIFRSASNSDNSVGMPYVKVYAGDVRVGGGVGATTQTCTPNNNARIKTYSNGVTGSGTQFAAFASGFIDRFVSGQYNPLGANPDAGSMPTKLTFANNAGGSGYGGGFGTAGACYNYVEKLPEGTQPTVGNTSINGHGIGVGHKEIQYIKGNAYINGNISYNNGTRSTASDIPLYELVVEGDIFIDARVTQLDGLYVALPSSPTAGGNIYTCAFVSGASATLPTTTYQGGINNCKRQLVVNGAFAAKQIKFGRDCGSLIMSQNNEPTPSSYTGGTDAQSCNGSNHAAEVFNFMPEVWIRSASGGGKNTYDSISSLPPIL